MVRNFQYSESMCTWAWPQVTPCFLTSEGITVLWNSHGFWSSRVNLGLKSRFSSTVLGNLIQFIPLRIEATYSSYSLERGLNIVALYGADWDGNSPSRDIFPALLWITLPTSLSTLSAFPLKEMETQGFGFLPKVP